jgi:hypothetical protein
MTEDEIIKRAGSHWQRTRGTMDSYLKMIIKIAREDEREACAKVCESFESEPVSHATVAYAIRARGEK